MPLFPDAQLHTDDPTFAERTRRASPVVAINLTLAVALLEDGRHVPFNCMFDDCGEPTDDPDLAYTATLHHPDDFWVVLRLDSFSEHMTTH